jgi:hypothetical protein
MTAHFVDTYGDASIAGDRAVSFLVAATQARRCTR